MGEEIHVDFNTGSGGGQGSGGSTGPSGSGASFSGPSRGVGGGDYDLSDPVQSYIRTAQEELTNPVGFFRSLPRQASLVPPLVFALISVEITVIIAGLVITLGNVFAGYQGIGGAIGGYLVSLVLVLILATAGLFISAGIYHLVVILLVKPVGSGYPATFRAIAYPTVLALAYIVTTILGVIPILGGILGFLISLVVGVAVVVLNVLGIREVHATTTGKAVAVVLIPVVVFAILGLILSAIIVAIVAAVFGGMAQ